LRQADDVVGVLARPAPSIARVAAVPPIKIN